jgi:hypothetical protein
MKNEFPFVISTEAAHDLANLLTAANIIDVTISSDTAELIEHRNDVMTRFRNGEAQALHAEYNQKSVTFLMTTPYTLSDGRVEVAPRLITITNRSLLHLLRFAATVITQAGMVTGTTHED